MCYFCINLRYASQEPLIFIFQVSQSLAYDKRVIIKIVITEIKKIKIPRNSRSIAFIRSKSSFLSVIKYNIGNLYFFLLFRHPAY